MEGEKSLTERYSVCFRWQKWLQIELKGTVATLKPGDAVAPAG